VIFSISAAGLIFYNILLTQGTENMTMEQEGYAKMYKKA